MAPAGRKRTSWWTEAEDDQLRQLVAEHGTTNWVFISQFIPGRSGKSCRLRWTNQIAPEVVHAPFTSAEDAKIVEEYRRHGNGWAAIARLLPGRTENSVKNRWHACLKHKVGKSGEGEGREEGLGSKRRSEDEGFGIEVGRASKKAKLRFSPAFSYISRPISEAMITTTSEITSPTNMVLSPSETSTEEQRSVVVSPLVSSSEKPSSTDLSNSRSDTRSSIALKPKNFDAGADDPLTALSRWFPYGDWTENTGSSNTFCYAGD